MRTLIVCGILILQAGLGTDALAAGQAPADSATATQRLGESAGGTVDVALQDDRPLLPQRPKDFDPMQAPPPVLSGMAPADRQQVLDSASGASTMYIAQQNQYLAEITLYCRWLVLFSFVSLLLGCVAIFYMRSAAVRAAESVEAAEANARRMEKLLSYIQYDATGLLPKQSERSGPPAMDDAA